MPIGVNVSFHREAELVESLAAWLKNAGFFVRMEVPILDRRADLVGSRAESIIAIELKMRDWAEALRQAIAYQLAAEWAWVAMPLPRPRVHTDSAGASRRRELVSSPSTTAGASALRSRPDHLRGSFHSCGTWFSGLPEIA